MYNDLWFMQVVHINFILSNFFHFLIFLYLVLVYNMRLHSILFSRSAPPETVDDIIRTESSRRRKVVTLSSNFFFAYGTRPSMKSFEKVYSGVLNTYVSIYRCKIFLPNLSMTWNTYNVLVPVGDLLDRVCLTVQNWNAVHFLIKQSSTVVKTQP